MSYIDKLNELRAKLANDGITSFSGKYRFLSNFWLCEIPYDGKIWKSTEHAYQAAKFTDEAIKEEIRAADKPGETKRINRKYKPRPDWDNIRKDVMLDLVRIKFTNHPDLKQKLIDTGNAKLVEGNTWGDTYFGVCNGVGENWLGKILMQVREEVK